MLIDRTHRTWFIISALVLIVSTLAYVVYSSNATNGPSGGSIMGLVFGITGTLMMLFAGFLAARKRVPTWRVGSLRFWLQGHLWLGVLSFPLILFHAGFGWGGVLENLMWIAFGVVWVSGWFGLAMQHIVPRLMTSRVPLETFASQLPYQSQRNLVLADKAVSLQCGTLEVSEDALQRQFGRVVSFLDKAKKDERGTWHEKVKTSVRPMLLDLAKCAKQKNWIRAETDFDVFIKDLYARFNVPEPDEATKAPVAEKSAAPKLSPLEQARMQGAAGDGSSKAPAAKLSPLELARMQGAGGTSSKPKAAKLSPLEQARMQGAAGHSSKPPATPAEKPAAKKPMVVAAAFEKKTVRSIKSEVAKVQALLTEKYSFDPKSAAHFSEKTRPFMQRPKKSQDAKIVADIDAEALKVRQLLVDKYGYSNDLATTYADRTFPFMDEPAGEFINIHQEIKSIQDILIEKYGYRKEVAVDFSERTRPFLESLLKADAAQEEEEATAAEAAAGSATAVAAAPEATAVAAATEVPDEPGPERTVAVMANIRFEGAFGSGGSGGGAAAPAETAEPASTIDDIEPVKKGTTKKPTGSKPQRVDVVPALRLKELKDFYLKDVRPFLNTNGEYVGNLSLKTESNRVFGQMRKVLPVSLHTTVQELEDYCEERRQFAQQKRLHGWLHSWLMLHIPFTIALYVFMAAHIIIALRVVPWSVAELKALFGQ